MKFHEMPYSRPQKQALAEDMARITQQLRQAETYPQARSAFLAMEDLQSHYDTLRTLANIRHDIDTRDPFYDAETAFFDQAGPELEEYVQTWNSALLESPFRSAFETEYGSLLFTNLEIARRTFSPAIIAGLQRENSLTTEYSKLIASAQIPFEGGTYTLSQLQPFRQDPDDARRLAAWKATGAFFRDNGQRLDAIYDELVHLRTDMGRALGQENYIPLGYWRMQRNCYGQEEIARFREAVVKHLVPLADAVYRQQAQRLGVPYPLSYADSALQFRSGNPRPCGTPEDILAAGNRFYEQLSPETAEFIHVMYDQELLDVLSRTGKAGGGYCTELTDYKVPFIFANFNGTSGDVEVITHEAGHAFASYLARDIVPSANRWPTMESCEVHSMSMEFFAWPWAESFFGEDARKFRYTHLAGALTFIPYGTMVDHFQHLVYEDPDMTPQDRHRLWAKLSGIYMPWQRLDGEIPCFGEGRAWQRQSHIYELPFYYIDYCLAQTMALQFWALIQKEGTAEAWKTYMAFTRQAGTRTFTELVEHAGLRTPFDETVLRDVCAAAGQWLGQYDLTGIR